MAIGNGCGKVFTGRRAIYTNATEITESNVVAELYKAYAKHTINRGEIEYLYQYYKGRQPILGRIKKVRPEINNRIVVNRANEIVSFKVGYTFGKPLQYINRTSDQSNTEKINKLNDYMFLRRKKSQDKNLAEWFFICGVAYRIVLPTQGQEVPFVTHVLDPRDTFIVRHSGLGTQKVMGVKYVTTDDGELLFSVYTKHWYYEIKGQRIIKAEPNGLGRIPIVEYSANMARLGSFEIVLSLLDALNTIASNRIDGIEQFIQALLVFKGLSLDEKGLDDLRDEGAILIPNETDIKYLVQELSQTQIQSLVDDIYQTVLTICGMPNRNGGSSTSDTGTAVIMRDGWEMAEARAQDAEDEFKDSECEFLSLVLEILNKFTDLDLKETAVDVKFTRRNYENIQEKATVLTTMLNNPKIHPQLAFSHSGMFVDSETAYKMSADYYEGQLKSAQKELDDFTKTKIDEAKTQVNDDV